MKTYALLCFLSVFPGLCFSQVDSTYIGSYERKMALKGYLLKNFLFIGKEKDDEMVTYMPNNPVGIGLGVAVNNTVLSFSYSYGFDFMRDRKFGKTKALDFQFHHYGRKFVFDLFVQRYRGFYLEDDKNNFLGLFPDLRIRNYGVFGQYVFNNRKFSYRAAFDQNEKQLKSAGSFLLGGGVHTTKIYSDTTRFFNDKNVLRNFQFGVSGGYAYIWAINNKWFVSGSTTVGINFGAETFGKIGKQRLEVYPTVFPRVAFGYNQETWSLGFSYVNNIIFPSFSENTNLSLHSGNFQMVYVKRLNTPSFLSKILTWF